MDAPAPIAQELAQATAWHRAGQLADAAGAYQRVLASAPDNAQAREGLGLVLHGQGRYAEAVEQFAELVRLLPHSAVAHNNLGTMLGLVARVGEAIECYERAIAIDPQHLDALLNRASALNRIGRPQEAIERMRELVVLFPDHAGVQYRAGRLFFAQGLRDEAVATFARAVTLEPEHVEARWAKAMAVLPQGYGPHEDPATFRAHFVSALADLDEWFDDVRNTLGHRAVGETQPFYLAFHETDNLALLRRYGDLCARVMRASCPAGALAPVPRAPSRALRIALVSGYFYDQSVWTALVRGWCEHLDRTRVELHLFHTGTTVDAETTIARSSATTFQMGLGDVFRWKRAIEEVRPDVILYPEIGMDAMCAKLASVRLAPTQMVSWGHPETSGLPTIDYFISGEAFEPPGAAANYRERLIALPNLGCYYDRLTPEFTGIDWEALGLDPFVPRLMCAGTPYKYMPKDDALLVEIARQMESCHFLFFENQAPALSLQIQTRLEIAFRDAGLSADRFIKFLPRQSRLAFFGMMRDCDVLLDTVGFSGFNTAMQAVECDLPMVAWEGRFMRGRLASGILRTMGMDELVATTPEQYVATAVRLCTDSTYRLRVGQRMAQQSGVLFADLAPVRGLQDLLQSLPRQ